MWICFIAIRVNDDEDELTKKSHVEHATSIYIKHSKFDDFMGKVGESIVLESFNGVNFKNKQKINWFPKWVLNQ